MLVVPPPPPRLTSKEAEAQGSLRIGLTPTAWWAGGPCAWMPGL